MYQTPIKRKITIMITKYVNFSKNISLTLKTKTINSKVRLYETCCGLNEQKNFTLLPSEICTMENSKEKLTTVNFYSTQ